MCAQLDLCIPFSMDMGHRSQLFTCQVQDWRTSRNHFGQGVRGSDTKNKIWRTCNYMHLFDLLIWWFNWSWCWCCWCLHFAFCLQSVMFILEQIPWTISHQSYWIIGCFEILAPWPGEWFCRRCCHENQGWTPRKKPPRFKAKHAEVNFQRNFLLVNWISDYSWLIPNFPGLSPASTSSSIGFWMLFVAFSATEIYPPLNWHICENQCLEVLGRWNFLLAWPIFRGCLSFREGRESFTPERRKTREAKWDHIHEGFLNNKLTGRRQHKQS